MTIRRTVIAFDEFRRGCLRLEWNIGKVVPLHIDSTTTTTSSTTSCTCARRSSRSRRCDFLRQQRVVVLQRRLAKRRRCHRTLSNRNHHHHHHQHQFNSIQKRRKIQTKYERNVCVYVLWADASSDARRERQRFRSAPQQQQCSERQRRWRPECPATAHSSSWQIPIDNTTTPLSITRTHTYT